MSGDTTITARQEAEAFLRTTREQYAQGARGIRGVFSGANQFLDDVIAEIDNAIQLYVDSGKPAEEDKPLTIRGLTIGDRVLLTGDNWDFGSTGPNKGDIVTILDFDTDGDGRFLDEHGEDWYVCTSSAELIQEWGGKVVDDTIRVGDTVRIRQDARDDDYFAYPAGTEFVVTEVVASQWTPLYDKDKRTREFYVSGDPNGYGVWDVYIEKVHA